MHLHGVIMSEFTLPSPRTENLIGKRFSNLTVMEYFGKDKIGRVLWKCKCDCGDIVVFNRGYLKEGRGKSCHECSRKRMSKKQTIHGMYKHPLYQVWSQMKDRCYNENNKYYYCYGKKGITVCDDWLYSFVSFYNWAMSNGYKQGLSIDRIDNDKSYYPENCRWITSHEQNQNQSSTKLSQDQIGVIRNDPRTNADLSKVYGVNASTISRVRTGFTWSNIK